jgi:hypothetical protein
VIPGLFFVYICKMDYQFIQIFGEKPKLIPISETKARKTTLELPKGFEKYNFYSINTGRGYFDIIEGKSGFALSTGNKGFSKTTLEFDGLIDSSIRNAIKKMKDLGVKIPADYLAKEKTEKIVRIVPKPVAKKKVTSSEKKNIALDKKRSALPPGKRPAGEDAKRKFYFESRRNRSDKPGTKL